MYGWLDVPFLASIFLSRAHFAQQRWKRKKASQATAKSRTDRPTTTWLLFSKWHRFRRRRRRNGDSRSRADRGRKQSKKLSKSFSSYPTSSLYLGRLVRRYDLYPARGRKKDWPPPPPRMHASDTRIGRMISNVCLWLLLSHWLLVVVAVVRMMRYKREREKSATKGGKKKGCSAINCFFFPPISFVEGVFGVYRLSYFLFHFPSLYLNQGKNCCMYVHDTAAALFMSTNVRYLFLWRQQHFDNWKKLRHNLL